MSPLIFGLHYYSDRTRVALLLLNVRAEASLKELAAQVKITQTYGNDTAYPIEATYSFPIPVRAVVCSFAMIKQDGTRVVGRVQEKEEARQTYESAVVSGQQASLMEQQHPDVFQVSVGNIPPKEHVKIELVYATELSEDEENDSVRFHLPTYIGARYGQAPKSVSPSLRNPFWNPFYTLTSVTQFLRLSISVEALAPISKIGCPSHTVSTELGPDPTLPNFKDLPFFNYARVSLSSESALDKDFVLTVRSAGLDAPRCVAELHPDSSHDTVAMALTLVPRFKLPDLPRQEFIILVDRSGSMDGARIAAARRALVVMLRALPHKDTLFQIISFGGHRTALWPRGSRPYNQQTLEEATRHVDGMRANYGGTEIRAALKQCFDGRASGRPTSVFMLTDGDAWDLDAVLGTVKDAVAAAPWDAPLRVSVLGIGNSVSTAMCEGIARVGQGTCILVGERETGFTGKIARLLKAARTPGISNISVDWGRPAAEVPKVPAPEPEDDFELVDEQKTTLNIFDEIVDSTHIDETVAPPPPPVILPPPSAVQQSPFKIRTLFPGTRLNVYAILQGQSIPETVTLRGSTADGAVIELTIPVTLSHLKNDPGASPAIHALAVRKIIQDLEDGQHGLAAALSNPDDTDLLARTVKASIVRLGTTYAISSAHTSFVAVDESGLLVQPIPVFPASQFEDAEVNSSAPLLASLHSSAHLLRMPAGYVPPTSSGAPPAPPPPPNRRAAPRGPQPPRAPPAAATPPPPAPSRTARPKPSVYMSVAIDSAMQDSFSDDSDDDIGSLRPADALDPVETFARLQRFDGCFSPDVFALVKPELDVQSGTRTLLPAGAEEALVATVFAMVFLCTKLGTEVERESWEGMYEKAREYVQEALEAMGVGDFDVEELEREVAKLIA